MSKLNRISLITLPIALLASPFLMAVDYSYSGFATVGVGRVFSGTVGGKNEVGVDCPCMIADYSQAAKYPPHTYSHNARIAIVHRH